MFARMTAVSAALMIAATPCNGAALPNDEPPGVRRSGTIAGAYLRLPLAGPRASTPSAGFRVGIVHDHRLPNSVRGQVVKADAVDLRLVGGDGPAVYVAGFAMTGRNAASPQGGAEKGGRGLRTAAIVAGVLAVGAGLGLFLVARSVQDE